MFWGGGFHHRGARCRNHSLSLFHKVNGEYRGRAIQSPTCHFLPLSSTFVTDAKSRPQLLPFPTSHKRTRTIPLGTNLLQSIPLSRHPEARRRPPKSARVTLGFPIHQVLFTSIKFAPHFCAKSSRLTPRSARDPVLLAVARVVPVAAAALTRPVAAPEATTTIVATIAAHVRL